MKKHVVLVILLIILFAIFIYFYLREVSYEVEYNIAEYTVNERYDKNLKTYYFTITKDNLTFELVSLDKYTNKRKLITDISLADTEDTCLNIKTSKIKLYDICYGNDTYYMANAFNEAEFTKKDSYENIDINELDDKTYLLWNYHDFLYLSPQSHDKITLFSKDIYNLSLTYAYDNYLLIPDYMADYIFDKFYVINTNNAKTSTIDLRFPVYFDSYFLGNNQDKIYLYDLKATQEYYIDLKKSEIYKNKNEILVNNEWTHVSNQNFQSNHPTFSENLPFEIILEENSLYLQINDTKIKLTNRPVKTIVKTAGLDIYYIADDILYKYNPYEGEVALLRYSEWNFNYQNMVFIFD